MPPTSDAPPESRLARWLDSDLVGIPATLYTFAVLAVSLAVFRFAGPVAGMVVGAALWIPMVLFAIRGLGSRQGGLEVPSAGVGHRHRILVIANQGLDDPALCAEVCRRADRAAAEAMVLAPVVATSGLRALADDIDRELDQAQRRVEETVRRLEAAGVSARGRADAADPMESLLDGLQEFPPNEVVMVPGLETNWGKADQLAKRVEAEAGLPVTTIAPSPGDRPADQ